MGTIISLIGSYLLVLSLVATPFVSSLILFYLLGPTSLAIFILLIPIPVLIWWKQGYHPKKY